MPCMCWYQPSEESKKLVKVHCEAIIQELKRLHKIGDPLGMNLSDIKTLLDHLWDPDSCKEKNNVE